MFASQWKQLKLKEGSIRGTRLRGLSIEPKSSRYGEVYLERFLVRTGSRSTVIPGDEVDWIEAVGDYAGLHVGEKTPLIRETLNSLERNLDPSRFVRIHRSAIVQISRIRELRRMKNRELRLSLGDGTQLKVSRTYRERLDGFMRRC